MKKILIILSMIAALITFNSCGNENIDKLKKEVEAANKECPVSMGSVGDMISIKYDEKANEVQFYFAVNDDIISIDALQKNNKMAKQITNLSLAEDKPAMLNLMVKADARLTITYKSNESGKTFKTTFTPEELKEIKDNFMSQTEMDKIILENNLAIENSRCPYYVGEGIQVVGVRDEDKNIVCSYHCDDEFIANLKYVETEFKTNLIEILKTSISDDSSERRKFELLCSLGKGVTYHFCGEKSGESVDITFTVEEIEELLETDNY